MPLRYPQLLALLLLLLPCSCDPARTLTTERQAARPVAAQPASAGEPLVTFTPDFSEDRVSDHDATHRIVTYRGRPALRVDNGFTGKEPGVKLHATADHPWDLTGVYRVEADVANVGDEKIQVEMFVGNDPDGLIRWYCSDYLDLAPGQAGTISVPLAWSDWVHRPQLGLVGMRGAPGQLKTDIDAIAEITFGSRYASQPNSFVIRGVRTVGQLEVRDTTGFLPFVDRFGQYRHRDWPGKTRSADDLRAADAAERAALAARPHAPGVNEYGGWADGPQRKATGYFRTEKIDGQWWLVDPRGHLFWSAGINCVQTGFGLTGTEQREDYFAGLPAPGDSLAAYYGQGEWASHGFYRGKVPFRAFNFYEANLHRKFGPDWTAAYLDRIHTRFRHWGMNTLGNVSDLRARAQARTPYVGTVWIEGTPKIAGSDGFWGKFHDVFSPEFRAAVRESMDQQRGGSGDPYCIGYFVDNEMSWGQLGSLAEGALRSPADQPAKQAFVADLRAKYGDITALNTAWRTNHDSWDALLASTTPPDRAHAAADLNAFYARIADTYFRTIREELRRIAPEQLYLGCRFAWRNNDVTLRAAARYAEVVSFNKYEAGVGDVRLPEGADRPILIGEFHFGALDRGHFHSGVRGADSQADRGHRYRKYIGSALRNPAMVGAHWFQYTDQVLTGREDGENYNIGFVDVADTPYPELIDSVRATNYGMYEFRRAQR